MGAEITLHDLRAAEAIEAARTASLPQHRLVQDAVGQKLPKKDNWSRGYFCAVAVLLKLNYSEGVSGPDADELFRSGGDWRRADPEDIETFRRHGLLPNAGKEQHGR